jgi:hypothetical protein
VYNESYLNTLMEAAETKVRQVYKGALIFRTRGEKPRIYNDGSNIEGGGTKWTKKFTASSNRPCSVHNSMPLREHKSADLLSDGTCKFNHVCNHWVSNKGKYGQCLNSEGTQNHVRDNCDNTHKCNSRQE